MTAAALGLLRISPWQASVHWCLVPTGRVSASNLAAGFLHAEPGSGSWPESRVGSVAQ